MDPKFTSALTAGGIAALISIVPALAQTSSGSQDAPAANGIYLSANYAAQSRTGGILEAIEACHRDGHPSCHIEQSGDITISSPQIVDLSAGGTFHQQHRFSNQGCSSPGGAAGRLSSQEQEEEEPCRSIINPAQPAPGG
jgi:hypothetical protein